MLKKIFLSLVFLLGLVYLFLPLNIDISQFPPLQDSLKSDEPDDTYVYPNTAAYFSNVRRSEVIPLYKNTYKNLHCGDNLKLINPFCYLDPIRNNRFIEDANQVIKDQILVTYLEEYSYPLKSTLFINGYEPYDEIGNRFNYRSRPILINDELFDTKVTLRIYQPYKLAQLVIYIGIWIAVIWLVVLLKRSWRKT